ncbi:MAG TPA: hypothetical protein VNU24_04200 [Solirubrobacteraceae bacterium]|jgi:hypothetical protein|nr:hypothetical protein [Solirubrobacteraceae bacterium]
MEPFTFVVVGAVVLFVLVGVGSFLAGGSLYDKIGEGGLSMGEGGSGGPGGPPSNSPLARAEREQEIRQMLQARSERQVRKGGQALDIDAEMALLEEPAGGAAVGKHDVGLTEEVRQLVMARNERRVRSGEEPMDVETEVQRTLYELDPEGGSPFRG